MRPETTSRTLQIRAWAECGEDFRGPEVNQKWTLGEPHGTSGGLREDVSGASKELQHWDPRVASSDLIGRKRSPPLNFNHKWSTKEGPPKRIHQGGSIRRGALEGRPVVSNWGQGNQ